MIERRKSVRNKTYLGGTIAFNSHRSTMDCLIRNMSPGGAKIVFTHTPTIPDRFDLEIACKDLGYDARIVWRLADEAGVILKPATREIDAAPRR